MGEEIREYNKYIFYYNGEKQGMYGVGFMVKKLYKHNIEKFSSKSDRIAILDIKIPGHKESTSVIQIYAPTEQATDEEKDNF